MARDPDSKSPVKSPATALRLVKIVHSVAWAFFAGCIVLIPLAAWRRQLIAALVLIVIVSLEVIILLVNDFHCPLTKVAARYTEDRRDNFDIYLPLYIARYNKHIFGTLFVAGILYTIFQWLGN